MGRESGLAVPCTTNALDVVPSHCVYSSHDRLSTQKGNSMLRRFVCLLVCVVLCCGVAFAGAGAGDGGDGGGGEDDSGDDNGDGPGDDGCGDGGEEAIQVHSRERVL